MTRRALLLAAFSVDGVADRWNEFAKVANEWAAKRQQGIEDVALMKRMNERFKALQDTEGWPK